MSAFRLVTDDQAGASALGILLPPGRRTHLILRPRALAWDLLLARAGSEGGPAFRAVHREEGAALAQCVCKALEADSPAQGIEVQPLPAGGHFVRLQVGELPFVACARLPGVPYRPATFPSPEEARVVAAALAAVLCPAPGEIQEVYLNTRHFSR